MAKSHKRATQGGDGASAAKRKREPMPENSTLYLKNLNDKVSIEDLRTSLYMLFSMCGHVVAINAHKSPKMRGQAHVAFANAECASTALAKLKGKPFLGKQLEIEFARNSSTRLEWFERELKKDIKA